MKNKKTKKTTKDLNVNFLCVKERKRKNNNPINSFSSFKEDIRTYSNN